MKMPILPDPMITPAGTLLGNASPRFVVIEQKASLRPSAHESRVPPLQNGGNTLRHRQKPVDGCVEKNICCSIENLIVEHL